MENEGTILIVGVGPLVYDILNSGDEFWMDQGFNGSIVIPKAHYLADCRASSTKSNRLFANRVVEAKKSGLSVVLLAPKIEMVDKRLRAVATTVQLRS